MKRILLKSFGYGFLYLVVLLLLLQIQGNFVILTPVTSAIFSAIIVINIYAFISYSISKNKQDLIIILFAYLSLIIGVLFLRNPTLEFQYTLKWYLPSWFKHLFSNRIVFFNVIGNILLFVPLGLIIRLLYKSAWRYPLCLVANFVLEGIQFITKLGVFDLTDVFLNYLGILIGFALYHIRKGVSYEKV